MHDATQQALEWIKEFQTAYSVTPDLERQARLISEEVQEFREAIQTAETEVTVENVANMLKEMADISYVVGGFRLQMEELGVLTPEHHPLDAMPDDVSDGLYASQIIILTFIAPLLGTDLELEVLRRVHESNMSKLGEDGQPIRREDGKVLKGPNYKEPDLTDIAETFIANIQKVMQEVPIEDAA